MRVKCECEEYQKGIRQIADQAIFCATHSGAPKYDALMFRYCPWCGCRLVTYQSNAADEDKQCKCVLWSQYNHPLAHDKDCPKYPRR